MSENRSFNPLFLVYLCSLYHLFYPLFLFDPLWVFFSSLLLSLLPPCSSFFIPRPFFLFPSLIFPHVLAGWLVTLATPDNCHIKIFFGVILKNCYFWCSTLKARFKSDLIEQRLTEDSWKMELDYDYSQPDEGLRLMIRSNQPGKFYGTL